MAGDQRYPALTSEVKRRLKDQGKKQLELAEALGISPSAVSQLLSGSVSITTNHLRAFTELLGDDLEYWETLLKKDEEPPYATAEVAAFIRVTTPSGRDVFLPHVSSYSEDPVAAGRYMASLIHSLTEHDHDPPATPSA
ncbi:MAG: helix-turn-helix transcriptional regulator [Pseudomonadota bacterium]